MTAPLVVEVSEFHVPSTLLYVLFEILLTKEDQKSVQPDDGNSSKVNEGYAPPARKRCGLGSRGSRPIPTPEKWTNLDNSGRSFRLLALTPRPQRPRSSLDTHSGGVSGVSGELCCIRTDGKRALWLRIEEPHIASRPGSPVPCAVLFKPSRYSSTMNSADMLTDDNLIKGDVSEWREHNDEPPMVDPSVLSLAASYQPGSEAEKALVRKIDRRIVPCIWALYT